MFLTYLQICNMLESEIEQMSRIKNRAIFKFLLGWISFFFFLIVPFIIWIEVPNIAWIAFVFLFAGPIASFVSLVKTLQTYRKHFKQKIVINMIKLLIENYKLHGPGELKWDYRQQGRINDFLISESRLFAVKKGDYVAGEDLISGQIGLTTFNLSEIVFFRIQTGPHRNSKRKKRKKLYNGVLYQTHFQDKLKGYTILRNKNTISYHHLNRTIRHYFYRLVNGGKKTKSIKLDSHEFNRHFSVRTTNELEARTILTPDFMRSLVDLKRRNRYPLDISFHRKLISIFIYNKKNYFEPSLFRSLKGNQCLRVYDDLIFFFQIVEQLNLNRSITSTS